MFLKKNFNGKKNFKSYQQKVQRKYNKTLRLMIFAVNNTGEPISLKDIARRQGISDKYLEQIISVLNKGKIREEETSVVLFREDKHINQKPEEYTMRHDSQFDREVLVMVACVEEENTMKKNPLLLNSCWRSERSNQ